MLQNIEHIFFDLDHTLWDFETNSRQTLHELFDELHIASGSELKFESFFEEYKRVNDFLWAEYRSQKINKEGLRQRRFLQTFSNLGISNAEAATFIEEQYVLRSPHKTVLMPETISTLEELDKRFKIHIITNGFQEVQDVKIDNSGLHPYISHRISSDQVGVHKPDPAVFLHALKVTGAKRRQSVMIGDHLEADVLGAMRIGMEAVYFNPELKPHGKQLKYEIQRLAQLLPLFA